MVFSFKTFREHINLKDNVPIQEFSVVYDMQSTGRSIIEKARIAICRNKFLLSDRVCLEMQFNYLTNRTYSNMQRI